MSNNIPEAVQLKVIKRAKYLCEKVQYIDDLEY